MSCIFCKIISGDIPSEKILENDEFIAILDAYPANLGHVLVMPKRHVANIFEMDSKETGRLFEFASGLAKKMDKFDGLNLLQNNGRAAGQTVFHFHLHLIPRTIHDEVNISWKTQSYNDENPPSKYRDMF
jgi:histidine triad (HIT) family protein